MSRADTPTLLGLDRFAKVMGINPVHFNGAAGEEVYPITGACSDVWWQRSYIGADKVSREDLAQTISSVEADIAAVLGYWPAPVWISREMHRYPKIYRPEWFGVQHDTRYDHKSVKLNWGKFIAAGRRAQTLIGSVLLVASDPDGDGFNELYSAVIATAIPSSARAEIRCYPPGYSSLEWAIRNPKSVTITGGALTVAFDFWQVIDPAQQDTMPGVSSKQPLNVADPSIYLVAVDIYQEFTDYSQHSVELFWEPRYYGVMLCPSCGGSGCPACDSVLQCGCLHVRDVDLGIAVPVAADWDTVSGSWVATGNPLPTDPDEVKVWYYAGEMSQRFLAGDDLDPLDTRLAESIAYMTVARLERPFCTCGNLASLQATMRQDYSRTDANGPSFFLTEADAENPFGTRKGEILAWHRVKNLIRKVPRVALV